jgi:hypothetical protein
MMNSADTLPRDGRRLATVPVRAVALAIAVLVILATAGGAAASSAERSTQPVVRMWDGTPVGSSMLIRTDAGITAAYHTTQVPAGQAVTLWFVVFNNPSACSGPCGAVDLFFNPAAQGDFLVAAGHVVGGSGKANFGGSLQVGDTSGSAFPEIGMPERAIGLTNPRGAQVALLLHSHGPALTGTALASQLSSFTGGCQVFQGDLEMPGSGLADGPEDVPDAVGECSTIQASVHFNP